MKTMAAKAKVRRLPKQRRAHQTVEVILDAVVRVLKREGFHAITTNRVAEVAGVSIGSVYQYFPDKSAIYAALHQRHIEEIDRLFERKFVEHAASPLDDLVAAVVEAMIDAHTTDPELYELLLTEVPHGANGSKGFSTRLHDAFVLAISSARPELRKRGDLEKVVFIVTNMIDALSHAAALRRPSGLSLAEAKREATRAIQAYLHA
ncbi:MAG: TetR/AcrR family transcriptional regulator [Terriglobales bacterium]|jgi:AcrR family transcriptional regulator